ncbi:ATP-binding protein [Aestuariivirga sp.]|uniref:ATP-binding protein n=1 Tax=Aestuariivirga sp. TaxID=2650926 RepID=UPI0039E4F65C
MMRFWPRSLPSWILILLVLTLAATQALTLITVSREITRTNRMQDLFRLGERMMVIAREIADTPTAQRNAFLENIDGVGLRANISREPAVSAVVAPDDELAELEDLLMARLSKEGILDLRLDELSPGTLPPEARTAPASGDGVVEQELSEVNSKFAASSRHLVSMQLADGAWLNVSVPTTPEPSIINVSSLPLFLGLLAAIIALCIWGVLALVAPYRQMERAAAKIGDDLNAPPISEKGSSEARAAIRAINAMQERLQDYVADREHLAAALAHDLRTPLTRLKLRCELMKDGRQKNQLQADVQDLENIIASVIDFASMTHEAEAMSKVDVISLLQTVCSNYRKAKVAPETEALGRRVVVAQPVALGRCITNLVGNAVRYGGSAVGSVHDKGPMIDIWIEDQGPGIPESELTNVLKPFNRLDASRNQAFGGTGLGLTIAETIARAHKGSLRLENRAGGGIRAILSIPAEPSGSL